MRLSPLKDHVIIRPVVRAEAVRGGVILPDLAPEKKQRGVVVATGPRCVEVSEGDEVLYERWGGVSFVADGVELLRMEEGDVIAVVERADDDPMKATPDAATDIWVIRPAITRDRDQRGLT